MTCYTIRYDGHDVVPAEVSRSRNCYFEFYYIALKLDRRLGGIVAGTACKISNEPEISKYIAVPL